MNILTKIKLEIDLNASMPSVPASVTKCLNKRSPIVSPKLPNFKWQIMFLKKPNSYQVFGVL